MNRTELIAETARRADLSQKDVDSTLTAVLETIAVALADGQDVAIAGFGKFDVSERAARKGRNPATGEEIDIAASKNPRFKAAKALKDRI